jgi:hypothetical protein
VLDLLGLPPHPGFQGNSLFEHDPDPNRSIYMVVQTPLACQSAIVRGRYTLLFTDWDRQLYLWDHQEDPGEFVNVVDRHPDVVADLAVRLRRLRDEQLAYYEDPVRQAREYPPVIVESP